MFAKRCSMVGWLVLVSLVYGCAGAEEAAVTEIPATMRIRAYSTSTPAPDVPANPDPDPTGTAAIPTATPYVYSVVANDTLIGIATRFNISLELLIAANPGLDPSFLSVGTELIIPQGEGGAAGLLPTPTPLSVATSNPVCYPTPSGGLWCFFLIENELESDLENLAGVVTLTDRNGSLAATLETAALINRLRAGTRIPLVVFFEPPAPNWEQVSGQVISAIEVPATDTRYLDIDVGELNVRINEAGSGASVSGAVTIPAAGEAAGIVWVVAVAYDANGLPVGIRRWESTGGTAAGGSIRFALGIYSLGGPIASVEILAEARPAENGG